MKILLDTHVVIWAMYDLSRLDQDSYDLLKNINNALYVSSISFVEIEIKRSLGKLTIPNGYEEYIAQLGFQILPFNEKHALCLGQLPYIHKDPFDRMLVAQCIIENSVLMTKDYYLEKYNINCLLLK